MADRWEQRERKLQARRERIAKHGRSLMTSVREAELKRAKNPRSAARRKPKRKG
ncbi:MAG TPA: hypothetical protein VFK32_03750 [Tepidiformaceae bacterium]|nr:hypothetical protein [Tepidiformaceae bacterium]